MGTPATGRGVAAAGDATPDGTAIAGAGRNSGAAAGTEITQAVTTPATAPVVTAQPASTDATSTAAGSTSTAVATPVADAETTSTDAAATPVTGARGSGGESAGTGQERGEAGHRAQSDSGAAGPARVAAPTAGLPTAPAGAATGGNSPVGVPNVAVAAPTTGAAPAPAAIPTPTAAQLAQRIVPLRLDADGVHRLTVNLHPADLGPVQVVAEIRNGEINVQLTGSTEAGNDALRDALAGLKRDLEDSGFANCTLDLRQGDAHHEQERQQPVFRNDGQRGDGSGLAAPEPVPIRPAGTGNNSRLDIEA